MGRRTRSRRNWLRWPIRLLLLAAILVAAAAGVLVLLEWRPEPLMDTPVEGGSPSGGPLADDLELLSWNIGYGGLGREADFFMDGGNQVRPGSLGMVQRNLQGVVDYLKAYPADVILLQEVDSDASRSFGIDQVSTLARALPEHAYARALNFKVPWIPYPVLEPLGRVESGLLTLSRQRPAKAVRHQLPGSYAWPVRVFHLKRCLHEMRWPASDGKEWVIFHLHLSAFDKDGRLRREQMDYLKDQLLVSQVQGHHVIAGGDWNQAFPGITTNDFPHTAAVPDWFQKVPPGWAPPGWRWAFDTTVPTLRATNKPYVPGENFVTTVDGFLVGPDIDVLSVQAVDLGFLHTDHHPVRVKVALRRVAEENPEEKATKNEE